MFWDHRARKLLNHTNFGNECIAWMTHEVADGYGYGKITHFSVSVVM